jgi:DNA-binding NarL/FixJ family response regulator
VGLKNCILLVDDNALVRINLRREFEGAGWEVCGEAASGPEAIEKAKELNPHLIIVDLSMPGMDGMTAARILKGMLPEVHLILYTMYGNLVRREELQSAGISAVFSKTDPVAGLLNKAQILVNAA